MQSLIRNHGVVFMFGNPLIEICLDEVQMRDYFALGCGSSPSLQHGLIQVDAIDDEIGVPVGAEV